MSDLEHNADLPDYDGRDDEAIDHGHNESDSTAADGDKVTKGYVGMHVSGFKDFLLKPDILKAIAECGFEHPSEVQHQCIPQTVLGVDVLCQAKSGMGKTAVFVISVLHQLEPKENEISCVVMCHTRELAFQISKEFGRFSKHMPAVKCDVFYGGVGYQNDVDKLKKNPPHIVVGTPGRVLQLVEEKHMNLNHVKYFVLDECDKMLEQLDMRRDVQTIFRRTPHAKQVMMFSATLPQHVREVAKKFMRSPLEVFIDDESKLTLHGLIQHYIQLDENQKNKKLNDLLDVLDFNQVVIFVSSIQRANALNNLLIQSQFPSTAIHSRMDQSERIALFEQFKNFQKRILVSTDLFGRGIDLPKVNVVINYDMPKDTDSYLHRVNRAGRFGTKGLAISFVTTEDDKKVLQDVQSRFVVKIEPLPATIDVASYMTA